MGDVDEATFTRQRRNLMFLALVLIFYTLAGAKLKQVPFIGSWLELENLNAVVWAFWIALAYSALRFYQYSSQPFVEFSNHYAIEVNADHRLGKRVINWIERKENHTGKILVEMDATVFVVAPRNWRRLALVGVTNENFNAAHAKWRWRRPAEDRGAWSTIDIPMWLCLCFELRAFWRMLVHTPQVTELWVPLALAATGTYLAILRHLGIM